MLRKPSTISRLRTLLLLALVIAVAALVGLFMFGQAGKSTGPRQPDEADTKAGEGTILIGEDFDYTFTEREKPVFRIRGDSIRADRQDTIFLDGVAVTFYDEQGQPFHVESKQASFNRTSNEGRLQGRVVLKGPSGLELRTVVLQIRDKGQTLFCPRPVELRYAGRYIVHGQRMKVEVENEVFILQGQARVDSVPGTPNPVAATAQRAIYERKRRLLRIEGDAHLRRGIQSLQASRISAYLSEDESAVVFVRALWNVKGQTGSLQQAASSGSTVRFSGKDLAVILAPQGNQVRKVELEGGAEDRATLETVSGGSVRTLTAGRIEGVLAEGVLSEADAFRGVEIREHIKTGSHPGLRVARGRRAEAAFKPDGHIDTATLFGEEVTFEDPQVRGKGDRATLDMDARRADLFGNPVEVKSEKGNLVAPRIFYDTENEILNAQGGVRAVLEQASDAELAGSPLAGGEGPVRVESREAFWRQQPSSFLFRGDVRAWRDENLMLTEQLRGDQEQDRLTASGGVKTIWVPEEEETAGAPKAKGATAGGKARQGTPGTPEASRAPIEVMANELVYQEGKGFLTYTGAVRVEQQGKTLNCQRLEVELNKEKKPRILTCTGQARLNDPKEGRNIEGDKAVYRLEDRRVEFTGNRVTMRDRQGNQVQGPRVLYSIDDGKVEVKGKEEKAAAGATGG